MTIRARIFSLIASAFLATSAFAQEPAGFENYDAPAGEIVRDTLTVALEAREVSWKPWGDSELAVRVNAFAVAGKTPRVPGPLIRVTAGTPVRVTVRNLLPSPLLVRGLNDRGQPPAPGPNEPAFRRDSLFLAPGGTSEALFTPTVPGTFFYYGRGIGERELAPAFIFGAEGDDGPFIGVLIVDPPGAAIPADEQIFVLTNWMEHAMRASWDPEIKAMVNGRSWPHTERLSYTVGDTVRWRVINASGAYHPMHLHGFYFRVDARGDQSRETTFDGAERRQAVTEQLMPAETTQRQSREHGPGPRTRHGRSLQPARELHAP